MRTKKSSNYGSPNKLLTPRSSKSKSMMGQTFMSFGVDPGDRGLASPLNSESSVDDNDPSVFMRAFKLMSKNKKAAGFF